jgi:23S rRNA pseudouridine2605 synthase
MPAERVAKLLAAAGVASRRGADAMIAEGRVSVDGHVAVLGARADPAFAAIAVDGRPVDLVAALGAPAVHLALHKPVGVTSTVADRHADRTVLDLVPATFLAPGVRLYPVGRLDRDSEGLLILTNDGAWTDRVLHPRFGVEREYAVAVDTPMSTEQRTALAAGIALAEGTGRLGGLRPATRTETVGLARLVDPPPAPLLYWYRVTLRHGWKRQLRRMFGAVGVPVVRLIRVRIGTLRLDLASGAVRPLTAVEVRRLGASAYHPGVTTGLRRRHP